VAVGDNKFDYYYDNVTGTNGETITDGKRVLSVALANLLSIKRWNTVLEQLLTGKNICKVNMINIFSLQHKMITNVKLLLSMIDKIHVCVSVCVTKCI
jgi:hypothetical protein